LKKIEEKKSGKLLKKKIYFAPFGKIKKSKGKKNQKNMAGDWESRVTVKVTRSEQLVSLCSRLLHSPFFTLSYFFMVALSISLLIWLAINNWYDCFIV